MGPREGTFYGRKIHAWKCEGGTWIEGEEYAYPNGGMTRRAHVMLGDSGKAGRVLCGIPDTYFSIPAKHRKLGRGFVYINEKGEAAFTAYGAEKGGAGNE